MKVKLEKVYTDTKSKAGVPYKGGQTRVSILVKGKDSEQWSSNFVNADDPSIMWTPGMEVNVEFQKNGDFWNWQHPADFVQHTPQGRKNEDVSLVLSRVDALEAKVKSLEIRLKELEELTGNETPEGILNDAGIGTDKEEIRVEDIPF